MKNLPLHGGRLLTLAALVFLFLSLRKHFSEIPNIVWNVASVSSLVATVVFFMACSGCGSLAWALLIRGGKIILPFRLAYVILGISQIRKYLPGNFFHYIARVTEGKRYGLATEAIILSMGAETLIAAGTAAIIGVAGFYWFKTGTDFAVGEFVSLNRSTAIVGFVLMSTATIVAFWLWPAARRWIKPRVSYLRLNRLLPSMLLFGVMDIFIGIFVILLLEGVWGINTSWPWYRYSWGFTLAWLLGFVIPGVSGGIGVREAVIVALFGGSLGIGVAAGLAVVLRIITIVADIFTFAIASWLGQDQVVRS